MVSLSPNQSTKRVRRELLDFWIKANSIAGFWQNDQRDERIVMITSLMKLGTKATVAEVSRSTSGTPQFCCFTVSIGARFA